MFTYRQPQQHGRDALDILVVWLDAIADLLSIDHNVAKSRV
jgi:hypothetical protein